MTPTLGASYRGDTSIAGRDIDSLSGPIMGNLGHLLQRREARKPLKRSSSRAWESRLKVK